MSPTLWLTFVAVAFLLATGRAFDPGEFKPADLTDLDLGDNVLPILQERDRLRADLGREIQTGKNLADQRDSEKDGRLRAEGHRDLHASKIRLLYKHIDELRRMLRLEPGQGIEGVDDDADDGAASAAALPLP